MKFFSSSAVLNYSWDQVACSIWWRYPNPFSIHVLSEDTVERYLTKDGRMYSKRLLVKTNKLPQWARKLVGGMSQVCVMEESFVDPRSKRITTYTTNLHLTKVMTIDERCEYSATTGEEGQTKFRRHAWVHSSYYGLLGRAIQAFGFERFKRNANQALQGLNYTLDGLYGEDNNSPSSIVTGESQTFGRKKRFRRKAGQLKAKMAAKYRKTAFHVKEYQEHARAVLKQMTI